MRFERRESTVGKLLESFRGFPVCEPVDEELEDGWLKSWKRNGRL